jgi:hypothetical protein
MYPEDHEIEELDEALELIQDPEHFEENQINYLIDFFETYGAVFDPDEALDIFEDKESVIRACQTISDFVAKYSENEDVMNEFRSTSDIIIKTLMTGGELRF